MLQRTLSKEFTFPDKRHIRLEQKRKQYKHGNQDYSYQVRDGEWAEDREVIQIWHGSENDGQIQNGGDCQKED